MHVYRVHYLDLPRLFLHALLSCYDDRPLCTGGGLVGPLKLLRAPSSSMEAADVYYTLLRPLKLNGLEAPSSFMEDACLHVLLGLVRPRGLRVPVRSVKASGL